MSLETQWHQSLTSACRTLLLLAVISAAVSIVIVADASSTDPRCAAFVANGGCDVIRADFRTGFHTDATTCSNGGPCPQCLSGSEWETRLASINAGQADRSGGKQPVVQVANWLTHELVATIFQILAREAMGYTPRPFQSSNQGYLSLCCDENVVMLETWPTTSIPPDEDIFSLMKLPLGYEGASGLFVHGKTANTRPLATAWNAYNYLDEYRSIFPPAFSANCSNLVKDQTLPCDASNYICNKAPWHNESRPGSELCTDGHYAPPQCRGSAAKRAACQEVALVDPTWDTGFFEGLVKNSGINFTLAYYGSTRQNQLVRDAYRDGRDIVFYWWEPDPFTASVRGQAINFAPSSASCVSKQTRDPSTSGGDCGYAKTPLNKLAQRGLMKADPDLKLLFESFTFNGDQIGAMLLEHTAGGGSGDVYNVSCQWVRNNFATWSGWTRNTIETSSATTSSGVGTGVIVAIIVVVVLVIAVLIGGATYIWWRGRQAVANAPTDVPLAIIFTDVEASTYLWETYPDDMATAIELHHKIFRDVIEEYQCYEVKVIGDAFMLAAPSVVDASLMCVDAERRLQEAEWPEALVDWKDKRNPLPADATQKEQAERTLQSLLLRGLRIRIGIHHSTQVEAKYDAIHQRFDYYGPDVNVSARVQSVAKGGQILMTAETARVLQSHPDWDLYAEDISLEPFAHKVEFKGVSEPTTVYSMVPIELEQRYFEPIEGAESVVKPSAPSEANISTSALTLVDVFTPTASNLAGSIRKADPLSGSVTSTTESTRESIKPMGHNAADAQQRLQKQSQFFIGWVLDALEKRMSKQEMMDICFDRAAISNKRGAYRQRLTLLGRAVAKQSTMALGGAGTLAIPTDLASRRGSVQYSAVPSPKHNDGSNNGRSPQTKYWPATTATLDEEEQQPPPHCPPNSDSRQEGKDGEPEITLNPADD